MQTALMKSIHESFYHDLKHPVRGFDGVEIHHICAHLLEHCGTPTREQLEANKEEYQTPHNSDDTVKTTMMKKKECQSFAAGTCAEITDNNLIQDTLSAFSRSGNKHFVKKVADFDNRPTAEQTWANLKIDMEKAETDRKKEPETTRESNHANAATMEPSKENVDPGQIRINNQTFGYCYTHGLSTNRFHTSKTCRTPCKGHKTEATLTITMGGINKIAVPFGYKCLVYKRE